MSHELYIVDGEASMAYTGDTPWHGLGVSMPEDATLEDWIHKAGFNWSIKQAPVQFDTGNVHPFDQTTILATMDSRNVLYRSDTLKPLSVMSGRYKIVQPRTVMEYFRDITEEHGLKMETAGILKDGSVYWALARTGQSDKVNGDVHNGYVLLATSADGSLATINKMTSVRVVCNNTLDMSLMGKGDTQVRIKHSTEFDPARAKKALGLIDFEASWNEHMGVLRHLDRIVVSHNQATAFFTELLRPAALAKAKISYGYGDAIQDNTMDKAVRGLEALEEAYMIAPGAVPGTAYGLVQGVSRFIDHERGQDSAKRLQSAWFGQGDQMKARAVTNALALAA